LSLRIQTATSSPALVHVALMPSARVRSLEFTKCQENIPSLLQRTSNSRWRKRKRGTLKSGSGKKVTSRKQAVAIGLSVPVRRAKRFRRRRRAEARRMVTEKGLVVAQAFGVIASGGSAEKVMRLYGKVVRANRRRLSGGEDTHRHRFRTFLSWR
jgi:hypothetical protein